jgi:tetratricopeptide (TPR) repeat protein
MIVGLAALFAVGTTALVAAEPQLSRGWEHFYNLEYDRALHEFQQQAAREPSDPDAHNHVAHAVLYREMHLAGALESELVSGSNPFLRRERLAASAESAKLFNQALATAMELAQDRLKSAPNDTGAMYSLGVSHALRANYNFLVRKSWMDSLKDATAARKLHNRVVELDPSCIDARLLQGLHDYVVGSLPWHWKVLGFLGGIRGNREDGIKTLHLVAQKGEINKYDAHVLLAALYRRERRPAEAIPLLGPLIQRFPRNYLLRLELAQMHSDAGNKEDALEVLARIEALKKQGAPGYTSLPLEKVFFYRGVLLFWYRDFNAAIDQLQRVTPHASKLDLQTAVMAWLRLGQTLDLTGRRAEALDAYKRAINIAPESDAAKESRRYLDSPYRRS